MTTKAYKDMTVDELDAETVRLKEEQPAKLKDTLREIRKHRDPKVKADRAMDRMKSILISQGQTPEDAAKIVEEKGADWALRLVGEFEGLSVGVTATPGTADLAAKGN